jgi:hypothetical protein
MPNDSNITVFVVSMSKRQGNKSVAPQGRRHLEHPLDEFEISHRTLLSMSGHIKFTTGAQWRRAVASSPRLLVTREPSPLGDILRCNHHIINFFKLMTMICALRVSNYDVRARLRPSGWFVEFSIMLSRFQPVDTEIRF